MKNLAGLALVLLALAGPAMAADTRIDPADTGFMIVAPRSSS